MEESHKVSDWQRAIQQLIDGRREVAAPIGPLPEAVSPIDLKEAMRLQDALNARLVAEEYGEIVGTKIGCTTQVMQEYLGMPHPCSGAIFDTTVQQRHGRFDFENFHHVGVECEIAVTLGNSISPRRAPHTLKTVEEAVASVHAAIEVVDDRYVDFENRVPDWRTWVADDFFGAGAVLGPPVEDWRKMDLSETLGIMTINGVQVGSGVGRDIINGHPLEALVWLANEQSAMGRELPAGWIVMLGSVVQTKWLQIGDQVEVQLTGLGGVSAKF